jgi:hypothetical protein
MTTKELSLYLKLHEITVCEYASQGLVPTIRIVRVWRFDKDGINEWIRTGQNVAKVDSVSRSKSGKEESGKKKTRK